MRLHIRLLVALTSTLCCSAFTVSPRVPSFGSRVSQSVQASTRPFATPLAMSRTDDESQDAEIQKLQSMAAKLRAEAAALEAEQANSIAEAAQRAFEEFDVNMDGKISVDELKRGLEKKLKLELSDQRVQQLLSDFDKNQDNYLQRDEFVTIDQFRNRLDQLARDEKEAAKQAALQARKEQEAVQILEQTLEQINDRPASATDRVLSIIPYLLPFLDSLEFAKYLVLGNQENPVAIVLAVLYGIFRSIPFGGLIAFFALGFLSGNLRINRLIRYNMQQAIYLDIALILPGLLFGIFSVIGVNPGLELLNDGIFGLNVLVLLYCVGSSVLGMTPNQIPIISEAVEARMPNFEVTIVPRNDKKDGEDDGKDK